jgi:hypothetical protein
MIATGKGVHMGIKRGQGQRTYKDRRFIERERDRIEVGDECAFHGVWRKVTKVVILPEEGHTILFYETFSLGCAGSTVGRSHNPIKKAVG